MVARLRAQKKIGCVPIAGRFCWSKRIYSLSCLFSCTSLCVGKIRILFLFLYLKADRPTHVYVMGDKHFPWRPVHLYAFPTTPCVLCLFAAGGFRRPAQEKPGINSAACVRIFKSFSGYPSEREYIGQAHQRPQRRQCRLFFFDKVVWWFFLLFLSLFVPFSFSASLNEIPPYYSIYNWIEILPMRGCCCVHVEDVTWAPTDGLFIFQCTE